MNRNTAAAPRLFRVLVALALLEGALSVASAGHAAPPSSVAADVHRFLAKLALLRMHCGPV